MISSECFLHVQICTEGHLVVNTCALILVPRWAALLHHSQQVLGSISRQVLPMSAQVFSRSSAFPKNVCQINNTDQILFWRTRVATSVQYNVISFPHIPACFRTLFLFVQPFSRTPGANQVNCLRVLLIVLQDSTLAAQQSVDQNRQSPDQQPTAVSTLMPLFTALQFIIGLEFMGAGRDKVKDYAPGSNSVWIKH